MKKLDIKRALADHNMTQVQLGEKKKRLSSKFDISNKRQFYREKAGGYCGGHRLRHYRSFLF